MSEKVNKVEDLPFFVYKKGDGSEGVAYDVDALVADLEELIVGAGAGQVLFELYSSLKTIASYKKVGGEKDGSN